MAIPGILNRRLATRSPGAAVQGLKLEATLIDERNDSFTLKPFFYPLPGYVASVSNLRLIPLPGTPLRPLAQPA